MRPSPSPRVTAYAGLTAIFLLAALALRRPELAVLALPFALPLALGLRLSRAPQLRVVLAPAAGELLEATRCEEVHEGVPGQPGQAAGECVPARWKMRSYFCLPRVKSSRV